MVALKLKCCQPLRMNFGGLLFVNMSRCVFRRACSTPITVGMRRSILRCPFGVRRATVRK